MSEYMCELTRHQKRLMEREDKRIVALWDRRTGKSMFVAEKAKRTAGKVLVLSPAMGMLGSVRNHLGKEWTQIIGDHTRAAYIDGEKEVHVKVMGIGGKVYDLPSNYGMAPIYDLIIVEEADYMPSDIVEFVETLANHHEGCQVIFIGTVIDKNGVNPNGSSVLKRIWKHADNNGYTKDLASFYKSPEREVMTRPAFNIEEAN